MKLLIAAVLVVASGLLFDSVSGNCNCVRCDLVSRNECAAEFNGNKINLKYPPTFKEYKFFNHIRHL